MKEVVKRREHDVSPRKTVLCIDVHNRVQAFGDWRNGDLLYSVFKHFSDVARISCVSPLRIRLLQP